MSERGDRISESTVARIAGNIASGFVSDPAVSWPMDERAAKVLAKSFVMLAREIVAEVRRAQPLPMPPVPREWCENGLVDCGPARYRTEDDVPLCARCWHAFVAEAKAEGATQL